MNAAIRAAGPHFATWACLAYVAFVVYGSLVPLDFRYLPLDQAWATFRQTPFLQLGAQSRADWVANGVLYVPVGFLGVRATGTRSLGPSFLLVLATACVLAFVVEFAQLYFPPRTVSQNDLLAEGLGSLIGALGAVSLGPWLTRWWHAWEKDPARLGHLVWQAYVLTYVLYCFFPFDFLVSSQEYAERMASGNWAWLLAATDNSSASLRAAALLFVELALSIPIGWGLARSRTPNSALRKGFLIGAALGLFIELGQFFIVSGVSQGASVLSRAVAVGLGAWISNGGQQHSLADMRNWLSRHLRWLLLAYLVPLVYSSGWLTHSPGGWDHAPQSWAELRFLPFYYHYFVSEVTALKSLGAVVVLFAPLAALLWARNASAIGSALLAAITSVALEIGKLFLIDIHPDPTNVLVAGVSVGLLVKFLENMAHSRRRVIHGELKTPLAVESPDSSTPETTRSRRAVRKTQDTQRHASDSLRQLHDPRNAWAWVVLLATIWAAVTWPAYPWLITGAIVVAGLATWWRPASALLIIPLAMPLFDLAPWSGRFFVDEFDLLCAAVLAIGFARVKTRWSHADGPGLHTVVFAAFALSLCIGAIKAIVNGPDYDLNSFSHYHSAFNGLRILKGALWAWMFLVLYGALVKARAERARCFHVGIAAGLALTVLMVLWERVAFVSLFDFSTDYRVTGPFSVMNKGGAYIECFLAVAASVVAVEVLTCRNRAVFFAGSVLLALSSYAVFVTYSRNGYVALAAGLSIALIAGWRTGRSRVTTFLSSVFVLSLVIGIAAMVLGGNFARERLGSIEQDLETRRSHWSAALELRGDKPLAHLFGVGLGSFPYTHFWSSRNEPRAAGFSLEPGSGNEFLRLGTGATVYMEQIVNPPAGKELELTINLRSSTGEPSLSVTLCRKSMLTSDECEQVQVKGIKAPGVWQTQYATIAPLPSPRNAAAALALVKLSLATPAAGPAIDVDNVSLRLAGTANYLTRNGSFSGGMDNWLFATDLDPPWHIHSLPVALLFDLGWVGLAAFFAALAIALVGGSKAILRENFAGAAAFAGLIAFLVSGSLNTLIDEPRFLWLLLVLAWLCTLHGRPSKIAPI